MLQSHLPQQSSGSGSASVSAPTLNEKPQLCPSDFTIVRQDKSFELTKHKCMLDSVTLLSSYLDRFMRNENFASIGNIWSHLKKSCNEFGFILNVTDEASTFSTLPKVTIKSEFSSSSSTLHNETIVEPTPSPRKSVRQQDPLYQEKYRKTQTKKKDRNSDSSSTTSISDIVSVHSSESANCVYGTDSDNNFTD